MEVLLVVDDESCITAALSRLLSRHFNRVLVASSAKEAEHILREEPVTHLICDQYLGASTRSGVEVLGEWRQLYPGLRKTVLFTGDDPREIPETPGIRVMPKLVACGDLLRYLKKADQVG